MWRQTRKTPVPAWARALVCRRRGTYVPVGVLDEDPEQRQLRVHVVPVIGNRHDVLAALRRQGDRSVAR